MKSPCPIIHGVTLQKGCQKYLGQCMLRKQLKDITCPTQLKTHSGLTSLDWHSNLVGIGVYVTNLCSNQRLAEEKDTAIRGDVGRAVHISCLFSHQSNAPDKVKLLSEPASPFPRAYSDTDGKKTTGELHSHGQAGLWPLSLFSLTPKQPYNVNCKQDVL